MYSIDRRYHWLLNEEKWWADDCHWSYTSLWHRAHDSLVRKKFAGMMLPVLVRADEGKKGPAGPAPSASIDSGGWGFTIRKCAARLA
jgi:hypothetical protein